MASAPTGTPTDVGTGGATGGMAGLMLVLVALIVAFPVGAQAAMYKCVDANGHTTFTEARCPTPGGYVESIATTTRNDAPVDCGIARNFASQAASAMKRGQPSSSVFARHGGMDSLSPAAISIVSYVYEFKSNARASASRVTELSVNRCRVGSFGEVGCDAFPSRFIADLGGCEGAHTFGGAYGNQTFQRPATAQGAYPGDVPGSSTTPGMAHGAMPDSLPSWQRTGSIDAPGADNQQCRARIAMKIAAVNDEMRSSRSTRGHDSLNERRRALGKQLNAC